MKTLKKAEQKNVELNQYYYSKTQIMEMLSNGELFWIKESFERNNVSDIIGKDATEWSKYDRTETSLRIACENAELKVILDDYGHYTNVLIKNNKSYYVCL